MSDTEVESLNTVSSSFFEEAMANLRNCANDCRKEDVTQEDYINFSTLLDYYVNDWTVFTVTERLQLMDLLCEIFSEDKALLAGVSWDLPELLIPYLDADWPFKQSLRHSAQIVTFYKVFNLIAEFGNPKELLLTCSEEIKKLRDDDYEQGSYGNVTEETKDTDEQLNTLESENKATFYISPPGYTPNPRRKVMVKFHALMECIRFSLERTETAYPSRLLAVVVKSLIHFLNTARSASFLISVLRTLYLFIRDYSPPNFPNEVFESKKLTEEEMTKLFEDEGYLQQKLIRYLYDALVEKLSQGHFASLVSRVLPSLKYEQREVNDEYYAELMNRVLTLALTLDLDIIESLTFEIEHTRQLFAENIDNLKGIEDIMNLMIKSYNNSSFREKDPKKLPTSPISLSVLYVWAKYVENWTFELPSTITTMDLIEFQLSIFLPYTLKPLLVNFSAITFLMIITTIKMETTKTIFPKENLEQHKLIVFTYLQTLSSLAQLYPNNRTIKKIYATFFKKFIQHMPKDIAYEFVMDTLTHCPHQDTIFNVLVTYANMINSGEYDTECLTEAMESVSIGKGPKLPARDAKASHSFIDFDETKQNDFIVIFESTVDEAIKENQLLPHFAGKIISMTGFIKNVKFSDTNNDRLRDALSKLKPKLEGIKTDDNTVTLINKLNNSIALIL